MTEGENLIVGESFLLPLGESTAEQIKGGSPLETNGLALSEVAALLLIQRLPSLPVKPYLVHEKKLAALLATLVSAADLNGEPATIESVLHALDMSGMIAGFGLLSSCGLGLMSEEELAEKAYLLDDGCWDYHYHEQRLAELREDLVPLRNDLGAHRFMSAEQSQCYREITAQSDDHIHIQGYAGTGKSTLIQSLLEMYESSSARVLVLADTRRQMESMADLCGHMSRVTVSTYGEVVSSLLKSGVAPCENGRMQWWDTSPTPTPDAMIIQNLSIQRSGELSEYAMVQMVRATLYSFCVSADSSVMDHHIPLRSRGVLDHLSRQAVVAYAAALWTTYVSRPTDNFKPKIRSAHQLKWLTLNRCGVPAEFTHVIVDECHDLSAAKLCFLELGGQAVISVGDEYQNLRGRAQSRGDSARHRIMQQSVRSGQAIEAVVNPIIQHHSAATKDEFVGNADSATKVSYYTGASKLPAAPCLILVKNFWGALDWLDRANQQGVAFAFLGRMPEMNAFVTDCIELFRNGTRARHGELFRYSSWQAVVSMYRADPSFQRIQALLEKGYAQRDWESTQAAARRIPASDNYIISFVDTSKNHEFRRVYITDNVGFNAQSAAVDNFGAAVYLAATRARAELAMPQSVRDWIEEIAT